MTALLTVAAYFVLVIAVCVAIVCMALWGSYNEP